MRPGPARGGAGRCGLENDPAELPGLENHGYP